MALAATALLLVGNEASPDVVAGASSPTPEGSGPSLDLAHSTAEPQARQLGPGLSIRRIETTFGAGRDQDFVIVFDRPVPDDRVTYVDDIRDVAAPGIAYTTQEWTPENPTGLLTCGASHFGFRPPPPVVGQLDVLIPGGWFSEPPDTDEIVWTRGPGAHAGHAGKTPLCGPYEGYVQFAIWAPPSHDPDDITVYLDGETRLLVEIRPGTG